MLIFLQLMTIASIIFLSRINIDRLVIDNAYNNTAKTISQSVEHTQAFVSPAYNGIESLQLLVDNSVINFNYIRTIEKLFYAQLEANKYFSGMYIANESGDFIYMLRTQEDDASNSHKTDEKFQTKIIKDNAYSRNVIFRWRKDNFDETRTETIKEYDFDPRTRPWYQIAMQEQRTVWTEPYTFFTSKKPGITLATPFNDKYSHTKGVIGIDIELDKLSAFLDSVNTNDAYIQIINDNNNRIAESSFPNILTDNEINELLNFDANKQNDTRQTFEFENEEYLFINQSLQKEIESINVPNWKVFAYAETKPFLSEVRNLEKQNIIIALTTLFVSILLSMLIAERTSKPVEEWINKANTDALTGLFNRNYFFNIGKSAFSDYQKNRNHHLTLLMIDIDFFKNINDSHGHVIGDQVLIAFANFLQSIVREEDILVRYGGEEFIVLGKIDSKKEALDLAERIRKKVENQKFSTDLKKINLTVSIGLAVTQHQTDMDFRSFIDTADKALYDSKLDGRNQVTLYNA